MSARQIWALSSGSYSDYNVMALFTTEALAGAALAADRADESARNDSFIETFMVWDETPSTVAIHAISEDWWDSGQTAGYREDTRTALPWNHWEEVPRRSSVRFVRAPAHKGKGGRIEIRAKTMAVARKVYSEQKAQWLTHPDRKHFRESEPKE